ncbi:hypothetical protein Glove_29g136 [Diversispora epigaea]|uniref:Calpain catalytic domain-containing protein n=1 Tax=Diversispora epigaea TaxID=1348612 RepID=A0A397JM86_9GLOM|nr:hypothetical protein Glove_29g136 [Diversispora epigaea]
MFHKNAKELVFSKGTVAWVPLLEKAFAKIHYSYESLVGQTSSKALTSLGGIDTREDVRLWDTLLTITKRHKIFTCSHIETKDPSNNVRKDGIIKNHAYTILRAENFNNHKLVQLRNPWAHAEWSGPWSDNSSNWDPWKNNGKIEKLNYLLNENDGSFFMEHKDFLSNFNQITSREFPLASGASTNIDNDLFASWWSDQYTIFYTDKLNQLDHATIKLEFLGKYPNSTCLVTGSGNDGFGNYIIEDGQYDESTKIFNFTKSFKDSNIMKQKYEGQYSHSMFFGKWGTTSDPDRGKFIIKRVSDKIELLTGKWSGYYFYYDTHIGRNQMFFELTAYKNPDGNGNIFTGYGNDKSGDFTISGTVFENGVASIKKIQGKNSWNYNGHKKKSQMWGTWGKVESGGIFLAWKE